MLQKLNMEFAYIIDLVKPYNCKSYDTGMHTRFKKQLHTLNW